MPILSYFPSGAGGEVTTTVPTLPSQKGKLIYTGESLTPSWNDYDPEALSLNGVLSATNAGSYVAVFAPRAGYCWEDKSLLPRNVVWNISKAEGGLTVDVSSLSLDTVFNKTALIGVTKKGDGLITALSSNPQVVSVMVEESTLTVTAVGAGSAVITLSVAEGTNHTPSSPVTVDVSVVSMWQKYSLTTTTSRNLWIPSQECTLDELKGEIEVDDDYIEDNADQVWTELPLQLVYYYSSVELDESGNILGKTSATFNKAKYICHDGQWYYVAENAMTSYMGTYSGEMYLFAMEVNEEVINSRGEYIEDVTSTNGAKYPENGPHTDGFWYVKLSEGFKATDDGNGNITILNATVTDDGMGNLTLRGG